MFNKKDIDFFGKTETPFYYYDLGILRQTLEFISNEANKFDYHIHYALKANVNDEILKLISSMGFGADCVSGNEIMLAAENGFTSDKIVFAGVGKSDKEIDVALDKDIFCFNVESLPELIVLNERAQKKNKTASIALRINPNVQVDTHHYITTGLEENKFGINRWELDHLIDQLSNLSNLKLFGLHFHIGSQITDLNDFKGLCLRVNEIQDWFQQKRIIVDHINVGGGLGINYEDPDSEMIPDFKSFFKLFHDLLELKPGQQVHFELGRSITAQCGSLISKVLFIKNGINTNFAILDAGMTELIRPALYQAHHKIENLSSESKETLKYDVVGPICESSDCFGKSIILPETKRGDLIAIRSTGAYGEVMASRYNARDLVKHYYKHLI